MLWELSDLQGVADAHRFARQGKPESSSHRPAAVRLGAALPGGHHRLEGHVGVALSAGGCGAPFGGAKGGVDCDVTTMSSAERRRVTRRFISSLGDDIGPHTDIPAPDMYTDAQTMAWVFDTYHMMHPHENTLGVVTGKPPALG